LFFVGFLIHNFKTKTQVGWIKISIGTRPCS
jgi:hypothetical protein